jgi:hypothetical protein
MVLVGSAKECQLLEIANLILQLIGGHFIEQMKQPIDQFIGRSSRCEDNTKVVFCTLKIGQPQLLKINPVMCEQGPLFADCIGQLLMVFFPKPTSISRCDH